MTLWCHAKCRASLHMLDSLAMGIRNLGTWLCNLYFKKPSILVGMALKKKDKRKHRREIEFKEIIAENLAKRHKFTNKGNATYIKQDK